MKYKHKKLISIIMTLVMVFGLAFTPSVKVFADTEDLPEGEKLTITQEMKDELYKKAREEMKNLNSVKIEKKNNNKFDYFNDNLSEDKQKQYSPNEKVRLIVELEGKTVKDYAKNKSIKEIIKNSKISNRILEAQNDTIDEVHSYDSNIKLKNQYSVLFNGFSVEAQYKDLDSIIELPGVKSVQVANVYYPDMNSAKDMKTKIYDVWNNYDYAGEGMVVSIIDSGIDYTHKDMVISNSTTSSGIKITDKNPEGSGKYFTEKVPYGHNFADNNNDVIDEAVHSRGYMHGMHVAGIVGANCQDEKEIKAGNGIKGIAPQCQLLAMKVFSNKPDSGGAFSDDIIAAIEDSVVHQADVINMSLGSTASFQDMTKGEQKAIKEATENGVVVVVSAGNSQYSTAPYKFSDVKDTGLVGSPGLGHESIQVASFENNRITAIGFDYMSDAGSNSKPIAYTQCSIDPVEVLNDSDGYEIVDCGLGGTTEEFAGKDLSDKIALIERGKYNFTLKQRNAKEAGAIGVIVYNNEKEGDALASMQEEPGLGIPALFIGHTDGIKIKNLISKNIRLTFNDELTSIVNPNRGDMSDFSSWGPTPNLDFKPQITGVGGNIWSTVNNDQYESMSGTSMSSPYTAGCTALIMQHVNQQVKEGKLTFNNEKEKAEFVKAMVINTAEVKMNKYDSSVPYSPRRQGAGLVDTEAAIKNKVTVTYNSEAVAALKEMDEITEIPLVLHNYSDKTITYKVEDLCGVLTEQDAPAIKEMSYDVPLEGALIEFDKKRVTVTTGSAITVNATITMSDETSRDNFAEGYIRFVPQNSDEPEIGIPYMGFYGEWDELPILDAPMYEENTVLGEGSLFTLSSEDKLYYLGTVGENDYGPIIDPKCIAINPDDENANTNVMPIVSFLRNAKEFEVNIKDTDGNIIRTVAQNNNLRKEILAEQQGWYKGSEDWIWNGKTYDSSTGEEVSVTEGQYYVSLRSKIDFEGADYQELDMPVKVDKTVPVVQFNSEMISPTEDYLVTFKASDNMTEINSIAVIIQDLLSEDMIIYTDADGNKIFDAKDYYNEETEQYEINIKLPYYANIVAPLTLDYAGNMGMNFGMVLNDAKGPQLQIISPKTYSLLDEGSDVEVEYKPTKKLLDEVDHFITIIDLEDEDNKMIIENDKNLKSTITGLKAGKHSIIVAAVDNTGTKVLDSASIIIFINGKELNINTDNVKQGSILNEENIILRGSVTSVPKEFKINGEKVTLGVQEGRNKINPLAFEHNITLKSGQLNKLDFYAKSKDDHEIHYAYNVYSDTKSPVISLVNPQQSVDEPEKEIYEVIVDENAETYTISGKVKDDMFGYKFFINDDQVINVQNDIILGDKTEREFSKEIELKSSLTIIQLKAIDNDSENTTVRTIRVYKGEKAKPILVENLTETDSFNNGQQAKIKIRAKNIMDINQPVTMIFGLFNEEDEMLYVMANSQEINAMDSVEINAIMNLPADGNYLLKCFAWDTIDKQNPMSNVITFDVNK